MAYDPGVPNPARPKPDLWPRVDAYLERELVREPSNVVQARDAGIEAGLPAIEVAPVQGKFLALLAQATGARRVLEFGTLAGVSTIWLANAVGPSGKVVTLELDPYHAEVARRNFEAAGLADRIEIIVGRAAETAKALSERPGLEPFDLVFSP